MLIHYLKTAWRNLLKYKTQNAISTLSLAVGVVCFAITLYIMKSVVIDIYLSEIDTGIVTVNVTKMTEEQYNNRQKLDNNYADIPFSTEALKYDFVKRLHECEIPSMKENSYCYVSGGVDTEYETKEGGRKILMSNYGYCSPGFFRYNFYNSAVTGKRIEQLRDGDVLITANIRDRVYGKGADPRGLAIYAAETLTITDVIETSDHLNESYSGIFGIFIVSTVGGTNFFEPCLRIELAPGATAAQLQKELSSAMPEYFFTYTVNEFDWSDKGVIFVTLIFSILLLGCSVLLIAVSGFLKMQLQLFTLRTRELALRRTMGARPLQLVVLLTIEIIIIFLLVTAASFTITALLADYALPIIYRIHGGIVFNLDSIYGVSVWVILCTLLITLVIASSVIYRQLRQPVGLRVGRSGRPRTAGQSIMLAMQLGVSMILILAVLGIFYLIADSINQKKGVLPDDISCYRRALAINCGGRDSDERDIVHYIPNFRNRLMQSGAVEHISPAIIKPVVSPTLDNELLMHYIERKDEKGNVNEYEYRFTVTDEELLDNLGIKITPEYPAEDNRHITAVYVPTGEVERLRGKWNLTPSSQTFTKQLLEGRDYTLIGYAKALQHYHYSARMDYTPAYWIVDGDANVGEGYSMLHYIIFPKRGEHSECVDAIEELYRDAHPNNVNDIPVNSLYDEWLSDMAVLELFGQLALLLVAVSVICIVASLYSSIALESRGRQKEVALRKIHGAKSLDIMRLFGAYYMRLLGIAALCVTVVWLLVTALIHNFIETFSFEDWLEIFCYLFAAVAVVAFVTIATIVNKIYRVSKINAADVIKKD